MGNYSHLRFSHSKNTAIVTDTELNEPCNWHIGSGSVGGSAIHEESRQVGLGVAGLKAGSTAREQVQG